MESSNLARIPLLGRLPYRMALAGGWIDQPFVSDHNPDPPGSMVVVGLESDCRYMDRCGMGTSTRNVARVLWGDRRPERDRDVLVRELYAAENRDKAEPSGSQDMVGTIYPGINRSDYHAGHEEGRFPVHVESNNDPVVVRWLEQVIHFVPVAPRPPGYDPLGVKNLAPEWVARLGQTGRDCFTAIVNRVLNGLGDAMNRCMECWEKLLPRTVVQPALMVDLKGLRACYQSRYAGAMYSGCGGGYLYVAAEEPVPGAFNPTIRFDAKEVDG